MKVTKILDEIRKARLAELDVMLVGLRKQLFTLRMNSATAHVKDYSQFKKLRRTIARVLTDKQKREQVGQGESRPVAPQGDK